MTEPCAKPCASCPWLKKNQTPEAVANSPTDGRGNHWFDHDNLRRSWDHAAGGGMMPCHATDRNAPLYGGKPTAAEQGRVCVGLTTLAQREVLKFMAAGTDFPRYRKRGGTMTLLGLAAWASRLNYTGCVFHVAEEELVMPKVEDDVAVGVPWATSTRKKKEAAHAKAD